MSPVGSIPSRFRQFFRRRKSRGIEPSERADEQEEKRSLLRRPRQHRKEDSRPIMGTLIDRFGEFL